MKAVFNPSAVGEFQNGGLFHQIPAGYSEQPDDIAVRLLSKYYHLGVRIGETEEHLRAAQAVEAEAVKESE